MFPDLNARLKDYIESFNADDCEIHPSMIPNDRAFDWLAPRIPLIDCPDKAIEKTYYYRWWTLRKHWADTPYGHILTEFSPSVGWAGAYNSINAALGHHVREARWMNAPEEWTKEYISFFLDRHGNSLSYSTWYASLLEDWLSLHPDRRSRRSVSTSSSRSMRTGRR
jgi:hypothetical protein